MRTIPSLFSLKRARYSTSPRTNQFYKIRKSRTVDTKLAQIDTLKKEIDVYRKRSNGNLQKAIQDKLRYEWNYHSNAIEGNSLTLSDTIFFLREGITVQGKPFNDLLATRNHDNVINYLYKVVRDENPINEDLMCSLNALLLSGITSLPAHDKEGNPVKMDIVPGTYKEHPNYVIPSDGETYEYIKPSDVQEHMQKLCEWTTENISVQHPVISATVAHYNFVRIHPFPDGNGRGARILMNLILMKKKLPPCILEVDNRKLYIECLQQCDQGDLLPFSNFIADAVFKTQNIVLDETKKYDDMQEQKISPKRT